MLSVTLAMIHGQLLYVYIQEAKKSPTTKRDLVMACCTPLLKKAKKQGTKDW